MTTPLQSNTTEIAIVIVSYNDWDMLDKCLKSIFNGNFQNFQIFVVDNSTTNEIQSKITIKEKINYHRNTENTGFCSANNIGIVSAIAAEIPFIMLLNHDTLIVEDCLSAMLFRAKEHNYQYLVTGKIRLISNPQQLWYAGGYFSKLIGAGKNTGFNQLDLGQFDQPKEVTYATGCCLLVPTEVFKKTGLLNEKMFMYLDDIEFCLRARKAGFRIFYEPKAIIYHELGSGSDLSKRPDYYLYFSIRNKHLVTSKQSMYRIYLQLLAIIFAGVKMVQFSLIPRIPDRWIKIKSIYWGLIDSFSSKDKYKERFPRLFNQKKNG